MNLYPATPLPIGKVLDAGFRLFRHVFKPILPLSFAVAALAQVPNFAQILMLTEATAEGGAPIALWLVTGLAWAVVYLALFAGLWRSLDGMALGERALTLRGAFDVGIRRALPMFASFVLYGLAVVAGFVLLLVPGLILSVSLSFCGYLVVLENQGPVAAVGNSHRLIWGHWWRTLAIFSVAALVYVLPAMVLGAIAGFIGAMAGGGEDQAAAGANLVLYIALGQFLSGGLLMPMLFSVTLVQLRELQLRKSGSDLLARAAAA